MENREQQILAEIKSLMSSVRMQLEQLDAKMAELQQVYEPQEFSVEPFDISLDEVSFDAGSGIVLENVEISELEEIIVPAQMLEQDEVAPQDDVESGLVEEAGLQPVEDVAVSEEEQAEVPAEADILAPVEEPEQVRTAMRDVAVPPVAVIDVMTARHAWRTDMPGSPVKDVRAAIALVDRALFINKLFREDAASFMDAINAINQMTGLEQAVEYLLERHPEWNFDSEVVYRFMMAVRRKVN